MGNPRPWTVKVKETLKRLKVLIIILLILLIAFAGAAYYFFHQTMTLRSQINPVEPSATTLQAQQEEGPAQATAIPLSEAVQRAFTVGEYVYLGNYSLTTDGANSPIEWVVLSNNGETALLLSTRVLDVQPYDQDGQATAWKNSSLRTWLNSTFLDKAFTSTEKSGLTAGLGETDQRFPLSLLSEAELNTYLPEQSSRIAMASQWAENSRGAEVKKEWLFNSTHQAIWWLRTDSGTASAVNADGAVTSFDANKGGIGVRPCCWIDLRSAAAEAAAQTAGK